VFLIVDDDVMVGFLIVVVIFLRDFFELKMDFKR